MSTIRQELEAREDQFLGPTAARSALSRGRAREELQDPIRPAFQRDRDRVIHSKAFRRLKHKTQVFFSPTGDHYRTRLTHTLEVSQIARSIAKVLRLHLRIVDVLENGRQGLNLTWEVRDGIARHSKGKHGLPVGAPPDHRASTVEGQIARVADIIAYVNHDIDDAVRAGVLDEAALPAGAATRLGRSSSQRINTMVTDVVHRTLEGGLTEVRMSDDILAATLELRGFLFEAVYENPKATAEFEKAAGIIGGIWEKLKARPEPYLDSVTMTNEGVDAATRDFVAGMTDRYAVALFEEFYIPRSWSG
jgi:dGTPase